MFYTGISSNFVELCRSTAIRTPPNSTVLLAPKPSKLLLDLWQCLDPTNIANKLRLFVLQLPSLIRQLRNVSFSISTLMNPLPSFSMTPTYSQEILQYIPHLPKQPQFSHRCILLSLPLIIPSFLFHLPQPPQLSHRPNNKKG